MFAVSRVVVFLSLAGLATSALAPSLRGATLNPNSTSGSGCSIYGSDGCETCTSNSGWSGGCRWCAKATDSVKCHDHGSRANPCTSAENIYDPDMCKFDVRKQWPGCGGILGNQMECGNCWAFASMGTITDRWCIANLEAGVQPYVPPPLSPTMDTVCNPVAQAEPVHGGCDGAWPSDSWNWAHTTVAPAMSFTLNRRACHLPRLFSNARKERTSKATAAPCRVWSNRRALSMSVQMVPKGLPCLYRS